MKRGAIFDMDGTLFDTEKLYQRAWLEVADEFGLEKNFELPSAISGTNLGEESEKIVQRFYPNIDAKNYIARVLEVVNVWRSQKLETMPGVEKILAYFKSAGVRMAVASSSPVDVIEENLTRANLRDYFAAIVGGNLVSRGKPAPDIFLLAAEKINLPASDCYVFEDSFNGIRAASASGSVAIMIPDQVQPTDDLKKICTVFKNLSAAQLAISEGRL